MQLVARSWPRSTENWFARCEVRAARGKTDQRSSPIRCNIDSAEKFREGSFDKGLYLRVPFDVMTTTRSTNVANLFYSPLTRDGGARLKRSFTLYGTSTARSPSQTSYSPSP